ncbi:hypothetical protein B0H16DRAFT_1551499, partial [Mycena metata]
LKLQNRRKRKDGHRLWLEPPSNGRILHSRSVQKSTSQMQTSLHRALLGVCWPIHVLHILRISKHQALRVRGREPALPSLTPSLVHVLGLNECPRDSLKSQLTYIKSMPKQGVVPYQQLVSIWQFLWDGPIQLGLEPVTSRLFSSRLLYVW